MHFLDCDLYGILGEKAIQVCMQMYRFFQNVFMSVLIVKNPAANAGDVGPVPGWGRSPGGGHSNPLQYSRLENPMDRGAWRAPVMELQRVATLCT